MSAISRALSIVVAIGVAAVACDSPAAPSQGSAGGLVIEGTVSATALGQTFQLKATDRLRSGDSLDVTGDVEWASSDPAVASVSASGLVSIVGVGVATVTARLKAQTASLPVNVLLPASKLTLTGNASLTAVGETSQLRAIASLVSGGTADVTNIATWAEMTVPSVITVSKGLLTAVNLGWGQINANYLGQVAPIQVTVTPPGTYIIRGFVKLPGHAGVAGFRVVDTQSGRSTQTTATGAYSPGWYSLGGLSGSSLLAFDKAGFEPAELIVTGPSIGGGGDVKVQQLYRINVGGTVQTTIAPHDVTYAVNPMGPCVNCRQVRVVSTASGTLNLILTWDVPSAAFGIWIDGQFFPSASGGPLAVSVSVGPGETLMYFGLQAEYLGYVNMKLTTSFGVPEPESRKSPLK